MSHLPSGMYRHYKGGYYEVLGFVRNEADGRLMVRYRPVGGGTEWVRGVGNFLSWVTVVDRRVRRFTPLPKIVLGAPQE